MYKSDRFQKVMERHLTVNNIDSLPPFFPPSLPLQRVAFTMYKSDRFQKVMERYLTVKNIDAPVDEVRFVVDTHHHTLAPELTPDDFGLEEGATINVCVPAEYLLEPVMGKEGEKEAVGAVPVVAPVREEGGKEGGEKEAGKEGGEMDAYM